MRRILPLILAVGVATPAVAAPSAPVAPRNCGKIEVRNRDYLIKADQVTCRTAKAKMRSYIRTGRKPSGWSCRKRTSSSVRFRCLRGDRTLFAIVR